MAIGGPGPIGGPGTIGGPPVGGVEYDQNVTAFVDLAVNITALKAFIETVTALVDLAVVQGAKTVSKNVDALADLAVAMSKVISRTITAALVDLAVTARKSVGKILVAALIDLAVAVTALKTRLQAVTAFVDAAVSVRKAAARAITAAGVVAGRRLSTGNTFATAGATVDTGTELWVNPGNITADDGTNASTSHVSGSTTSDTLKGSVFGLAVPDGAEIKGIELVIQLSMFAVAGTTPTVASVNIGKSDGVLATAKTPGTVLTTTPTDYTYGSPTDLWGLAWTAAEVNASTFQGRLAVTLGNGVQQVNADAMWINVYYVPSFVTKAVSKFLTPLVDLAVTARKSVGKAVRPLIDLAVTVATDAITVTSQIVTAFVDASVTVTRTLALTKAVTALVDLAMTMRKAVSHLVTAALVDLAVAARKAVSRKITAALVDLAVTARKSVGKNVDAFVDLLADVSAVIAAIVQQLVTASIIASVTVTQSIGKIVTALVTAAVRRLHAFVCYVQDGTPWSETGEQTPSWPAESEQSESWSEAVSESDLWSIDAEQEDAAEEQQAEPEPECCED